MGFTYCWNVSKCLWAEALSQTIITFYLTFQHFLKYLRILIKIFDRPIELNECEDLATQTIKQEAHHFISPDNLRRDSFAEVKFKIQNETPNKLTPQSSNLTASGELETSKESEIVRPKELQFINSGTSLATRCDVVYKTLLRDCRKYFADSLQMRDMRKSKKLSRLAKTLDEFVRSRFEGYGEKDMYELKFYLGWLVYPKEMISSRAGLLDQHNKMLKGEEKKQRICKIKQMHSFLYNFSMQKWEQFFEITPLITIFREYMDEIENRLMINSTMRRNRQAYRTALRLIESKMLQNNQI